MLNRTTTGELNGCRNEKELLEAYEAVRKKAHDACKILTLSMARGLKDEKRPTWKEFCIAFEALDAICDEKPNE